MELSFLSMLDIALVIIVLLLIVLVFFLITKPQRKDDISIKILQEQILNLNRTLDNRLTRSNDTI
jgi:preprotein translocase subunit YajC